MFPSLVLVLSVCTALTLVIPCECPLFMIGEGVCGGTGTGPVYGGYRMSELRTYRTTYIVYSIIIYIMVGAGQLLSNHVAVETD